jgi:ribosomal protein S16
MRNFLAMARWLIPAAMVCPLACAPTAAPPPIPTGNAAIDVPGAVAGIDEITLERFGHAPNAPFYKIVLSKDGTAIDTGEFNVARIGTFQTKIEPEGFRRLEEMFDRFHYFEMKDGYPFGVDAPEVRTSASRAGQRKTIDDGWGSTAPVELWAIEMAIDGLIAHVTDWTQTK